VLPGRPLLPWPLLHDDQREVFLLPDGEEGEDLLLEVRAVLTWPAEDDR
jgi:hypothetical protein